MLFVDCLFLTFFFIVHTYCILLHVVKKIQTTNNLQNKQNFCPTPNTRFSLMWIHSYVNGKIPFPQRNETQHLHSFKCRGHHCSSWTAIIKMHTITQNSRIQKNYSHCFNCGVTFLWLYFMVKQRLMQTLIITAINYNDSNLQLTHSFPHTTRKNTAQLRVNMKDFFFFFSLLYPNFCLWSNDPCVKKDQNLVLNLAT